MGDLFWPGDARAGDLFTERAFLAAMVAVESAWAGTELTVPEGELDVEAGGNPVIPLLAALRAAHPDVALHEGLTSQDVLDTALMLLLEDAIDAVEDDVRRILTRLDALAAEHRDTPMLGRTLTQPALPITFGGKVATWAYGVREARIDLEGCALVGSGSGCPARPSGPSDSVSRTPRPGTPRAGRSPGPAMRSSRPPMRAAGSPVTCWCWAGPRSASSARRWAAARPRCRTRRTRCSPSWSAGPR